MGFLVCFFLNSANANCLENLMPFSVMSGHPPKSLCRTFFALFAWTNIGLFEHAQPEIFPEKHAFDIVKVIAAEDNAYTNALSLVSVYEYY